MQSAITDLWNGNCSPCENCGVGDFEIENLTSVLESCKETLKKELGEQQWMHFRKYADGADRLAGLLAEQAFRDGFCMASRMMCEALIGQ